MKIMTFQVPEEVYSSIKAIAEAEDRSIASVLRRAVKQWLLRYKEESVS